MSFFAMTDIIIWLFTEIETQYEVLRGARAIKTKFKTEGVSAMTRILSVFFVGFLPLSVVPQLVMNMSWKCQMIAWVIVLLLIIPVTMHYLVRVFFYLKERYSYCEALQKQSELCRKAGQRKFHMDCSSALSDT